MKQGTVMGPQLDSWPFQLSLLSSTTSERPSAQHQPYPSLLTVAYMIFRDTTVTLTHVCTLSPAFTGPTHIFPPLGL